MKLDRGEFLKAIAALGGLGLAAAVLEACGSDGGGGSGGYAGNSGGGYPSHLPPPTAKHDAGSNSDADTPNACDVQAPAATIANNHGHVLVVSQAEAAAGDEKTYDIRGTNTSHTHSVTVTSEMFAKLRAGNQVTTTSTTDAGHTHGITVVCA